METVKLMVVIRPPTIDDGPPRARAEELARWWLSILDAAAPSPRWWHDGHPEPVGTDEVGELMTDLDAPEPWPFHSWSVLAGRTAREFFAKITIQADRTSPPAYGGFWIDRCSTAEALLRVDTPEQARSLEDVYESLIGDPRTAGAAYAMGATFFLDQHPDPPLLGPQPWSIGWRTWLPWKGRRPPITVPDEVTIARRGGGIEVTLAPDPAEATPQRAVVVRDALIAAGHLPRQGAPS